MMQLHTCLWNDVDAFSFCENDFLAIKAHFPDLVIKIHPNVEAFLSQAQLADFLLTWDFEEVWYDACSSLKIILTPAAGDGWVFPDPHNKIKLFHGTFHGQMLAESLLSAMLFMNHNMPAMIRNHQAKKWDRNHQGSSRLLGNQHVLIVGLGKIGSSCASLIQQTGAEVIGIRRNPGRDPDGNIDVRSLDELDGLLPWADHVVLLLPGAPDTDRLMNTDRLALMKTGSYIYNFGRGNSLATIDLLKSLPHLGGAFLDVTDEEPLHPDSPLWDSDKVMITPHSSCIYDEYKSLFINEVIDHLKQYLS